MYRMNLKLKGGAIWFVIATIHKVGLLVTKTRISITKTIKLNVNKSKGCEM